MPDLLLTEAARTRTIASCASCVSGTLDPICALRSIEVINLSSNFLTGSISNKIGSLSTLQHLFLSENKLSGKSQVFDSIHRGRERPMRMHAFEKYVRTRTYVVRRFLVYIIYCTIMATISCRVFLNYALYAGKLLILLCKPLGAYPPPDVSSMDWACFGIVVMYKYSEP